MVFNKIDRFGGDGLLKKYLDMFPKAAAVSAMTGQGIAELLEEVGTQLRPIREYVELRVPHDNSAVMARLHEVAQVTERDYAGAQARFKARIPPHFHAEFEPYIIRHLANGKPA